MNKNCQLLGLLASLLLLAAGVFFLNENMHSSQLALRSRHSNPVRLYIRREIKTDLYKPTDGPQPLTGWEMSGVGNSSKEGMMQTKTSAPSDHRTKKGSADSTQAGNREKDLDSLASANRDSAASK
ncbi:hypothetical protein [Dyadobacter psychrophilus]|uniref:Uncharacterized protein n=1 Tax=Dyadobacter psychrophilus TaxID=651661 RepID=A0A1T5BWA0_9BACT|nr:hypothetical protein [Dyadobacter psychrophilus]SKB51150.1 hypothetical protein SAMN05660293_00638 [Dyadobacter psychrophilus]